MNRRSSARRSSPHRLTWRVERPSNALGVGPPGAQNVVGEGFREAASNTLFAGDAVLPHRSFDGAELFGGVHAAAATPRVLRRQTEACLGDQARAFVASDALRMPTEELSEILDGEELRGLAVEVENFPHPMKLKRASPALDVKNELQP